MVFENHRITHVARPDCGTSICIRNWGRVCDTCRTQAMFMPFELHVKGGLILLLSTPAGRCRN